MMKNFKTWFSRHSMHAKLSVSFSATIIGILLLIMVSLSFFISNGYRERILYSANQSYEQAYSFLENYIKNMIYASELLYYNGDLQRVLNAADFNGSRNEAEQYREFLLLNQVFTSAELNETIYRARIFIPDEINYSDNIWHFAGMSLLEGREDYGDFLAHMQNGKFYFTSPEDIKLPNNEGSVSIVSLLRTIRSIDGAMRTIGVEQVSIQTSQIQSVLDKSNITSTGLVYLVNQSGGLICVSKYGTELLDKLLISDAMPEYKSENKWKTYDLDGAQYLVNQKQLIDSNWTLVALIPEKELREQSRQIRFIVFMLTIVAVIAVSSVSHLISKHYTKRLNILAAKMSSLQNGNLEIKFEDSGHDEIGELFKTFTYMTSRLEKLMQEQYKSGKAVKTAQFLALQAQINPHFLYNTLDLINWEAIDHDAPEIVAITQSLAQFYRISLNKGKQILTIEEEIKHVESYVSIENRYFDGAISFVIDVPDSLMTLACINIILQPFVENAIMHNIAKDSSIHECNITLSARQQGQDIIFKIVDDGVGMTEKQIEEIFAVNTSSHSHGYGIKNINSRIKLCYGDMYGLTYESRIGHGTSVEIRIPALSPSEAEQRLQ